ncbi:MAG: hypothetical protein DCC75_09515 [Proteobacteria bacterium]|nr:MAG: hypothetical protein DCC75_09515 [Pseudomonadota bacterium]
MSLWLLNRLFESEGQRAERERQNERRRIERIKAKRRENLRRARELDKLRDGGGYRPVEEVKEAHEYYAFDRDKRSKNSLSSSVLNFALPDPQGGAAESRTGYKHGKVIDSANPCQLKTEAVNSKIRDYIMQQVSRIKRPF